jgi:hypothetical protein
LCAGFTLLLVKSYMLTSSLSGAIVRSVTKLASITFLSLAFSYWFDSTLVSQLREHLLLCSSYLLLGFPTGRSSISTLHHHSRKRPCGFCFRASVADHNAVPARRSADGGLEPATQGPIPLPTSPRVLGQLKLQLA